MSAHHPHSDRSESLVAGDSTGSPSHVLNEVFKHMKEMAGKELSGLGRSMSPVDKALTQLPVIILQNGFDFAGGVKKAGALAAQSAMESIMDR